MMKTGLALQRCLSVDDSIKFVENVSIISRLIQRIRVTGKCAGRSRSDAP